MEILQHMITELIPLVLLRLVIPRRPDIAFRKLTEANQSPLYLVMLCGYAFNALVNVSTDRCVARRNVDHFLTA
jgi:hypothetical protein